MKILDSLFIIILLPVISIFIIMAIPSSRPVLLKRAALALSFFIFVFSNFLYFNVSGDNSFFSFSLERLWIPALNLRFYYGVDGISVFLIVLTSFLMPICILCSWESITTRLKTFLLMLFLTEFFLFNAFSVLDLILFYIFFESVLIPMFLIIGIWGSRERRIHAAYQFFLYTFLGSLFMLLGIVYLYSTFGTTDYLFLLKSTLPFKTQIILWLSFFLSFAVKVPMIPFHIWLPEAHVEAPTAGSVLLAGVLLKLGTYGFMRFSLPLFPEASKYFTPLLLTIGIIGIIYASCTTLRQIDLKKIVAYSSVAHMSLVIVGLFSDSLYGLEGALYLMLSHGIVSSGLFLCVGVLYDRYHTRIIRYYGGMTLFMPLFSFLFLSFSLANMGFPGTSAFVGEFLILISVFFNNTFSAFVASVGVVLSAAYSMWCYNRVMFGPASSYITKFADVNSREFFYLFILIALVVVFGVFPDLLLSFMHAPCLQILLAKRDWPLSFFF